MNHGFFGFPAQINFSENQIKTFDQSGAYTILPGTKKLYIFAVAGGGGGGGGRCSASGVNAYGGGGGSGGGFVYQDFPISVLGGPGQTLFINIGAGGTGGVGQTVAGTDGGAGNPGGDTTIRIAGLPGFLITTQGGNGGSGGTSASPASGGTGRNCLINGYTIATSNGNTSIVTNLLVSSGSVGGNRIVTTGTGGAITTQTTVEAGVGTQYFLGVGSDTIYAGGLTDTLTPPADSNRQIAGLMSPGFGGPGGGAATTTGANRGGNGYRGSGGGGGGAAQVVQSGKGGNGGNGFVAILAV